MKLVVCSAKRKHKVDDKCTWWLFYLETTTLELDITVGVIAGVESERTLTRADEIARSVTGDERRGSQDCNKRQKEQRDGHRSQEEWWDSPSSYGDIISHERNTALSAPGVVQSGNMDSSWSPDQASARAANKISIGWRLRDITIKI